VATIRHDQYMKQRFDEYGNYGENNPPSDPDMVNSPPHYTHGANGIECIDAIEAALGPEGFKAFLRGNIIKYNFRCDHKGGVQDMEKARWYLEKLIEKERLR
jgi:hypothetical protein